MFKGYIIIGLRRLWHNKLYSLINSIGLGIGICCLLLAVLYWKDERSFDNFHNNIPHLYRITTFVNDRKTDKNREVGGTGQVQGPAFKNAIPEITDYARLLGGDIYGDITGNNKALHLKLLFADESFFNIFSLKLLRGNPQLVLKSIDAAVITRSTALKFFNSIDVVGKMLQMDSDPSAKKLAKPLIITGVVEDPPKNSSIQFDVLFTLKFMQLSFEDNNWLNQYLGTFILLHPNADKNAVIRKFNKVYAAHAKEQIDQNIKTYGFDPQISYGLQPITDIHLHPKPTGTGWREGGIVNESHPASSFMFMGIAIFILTMAAINFINISIAGSLKRAKEVGVRKITGGSKYQIIFQFLFESAMLCFLAFCLSVVLTQLLLPLFNQLAAKQISFNEAMDKQLFTWFALILTLIVLLTGLYPAYVLSAFKPREVLYNKQKLSGGNILGRSLVVIQFSLSFFLILSSLIYYRQMNYIQTKDLGYNPYQVIRTYIGGDRDIKPVQQLLRNELAKEPAVKVISFGGDSGESEVKLDTKTVKAVHLIIDENRLAAVEIPLKTGRNFSAEFPTDKTKGAIVNEAFVKAAGLTQPLGTQIRTNEYFDKEVKTIVGVVKDFHIGSLREPIKPVVMIMSDWYSGGIWIKIDKSKQQKAIAAIQEAYKRVLPNSVFQYNFLDEMNAKEYEQDQRWQKIIGVTTMLSIIICCLGLFGLAHLAAHQRIKEIGIRKVLGASVTGIVQLLSMDFIKLVIISIVIASPVAWWIMNAWLQDFAYRTRMTWWVFGLSGLAMIMIALLTLSIQTIRSASANPVKSLRTE